MECKLQKKNNYFFMDMMNFFAQNKNRHSGASLHARSKAEKNNIDKRMRDLRRI